jgi:hypothetical protein
VLHWGTMRGQEGKDELASPKDYMSYLLRLWRVGQGRDAHWRASLQRPGTEEPIWFADLEELVAFLRAETGKVESG